MKVLELIAHRIQELRFCVDKQDSHISHRLLAQQRLEENIRLYNSIRQGKALDEAAILNTLRYVCLN